MKENEESMRRRIAEWAGEPGEADRFCDFIARSEPVDLDKFVEEIDGSDYGPKDWIKAFLGFDLWLTKQGFAERDFSNMLGYLHCCQIMIAKNVDRPDLQLFVTQALTEFGYDPATPSQS